MQNIQPKYEVGTRIYFRGNRQQKYKVADYVYYKSTDTWYYWLRGVQKKSILGVPEWVYVNDAKQLMISRVDNDNRVVVIKE